MTPQLAKLVLPVLIDVSIAATPSHFSRCPNTRLVKWADTEIFIQESHPAMEQTYSLYDPLEPSGAYFCVEEAITCTFYMDWDGFIRQCKPGTYIP